MDTLTLLGIAATIAASTQLSADPGPWSTADTVRQSTYITLALLDWDTTLRFTAREGTREGNPLLGKRPPRSRVNLLIGGAILAHTAMALHLPHPYRQWWQYTFIYVEGIAVYNNCKLASAREGGMCGRIGAGFHFSF